MPTRNAIIAEARSWIGTPYHHRASLKGVGCDCLGLVRGVWRAFYGEEPERLPPYTPHWAEAAPVERLAQAGFRYLQPLAVQNARPGDVVLFRWRDHLPAKHAAILSYTGEAGEEVGAGGERKAGGAGCFIHAFEAAMVVETDLSAWWRRRMVFAFAFPDIVEIPAHM